MFFNYFAENVFSKKSWKHLEIHKIFVFRIFIIGSLYGMTLNVVCNNVDF